MESIQSLLEQAQQCKVSGRPEKAEEIYRKILNDQPECHEAAFGLSIMLDNINDAFRYAEIACINAPTTEEKENYATTYIRKLIYKSRNDVWSARNTFGLCNKYVELLKQNGLYWAEANYETIIDGHEFNIKLHTYFFKYFFLYGGPEVNNERIQYEGLYLDEYIGNLNVMSSIYLSRTRESMEKLLAIPNVKIAFDIVNEWLQLFYNPFLDMINYDYGRVATFFKWYNDRHR